ncbi:hypothetical protein ACGYLA_17040 [Sulfitobacter sp. 1A13679]
MLQVKIFSFNPQHRVCPRLYGIFGADYASFQPCYTQIALRLKGLHSIAATGYACRSEGELNQKSSSSPEGDLLIDTAILLEVALLYLNFSIVSFGPHSTGSMNLVPYMRSL